MTTPSLDHFPNIKMAIWKVGVTVISFFGQPLSQTWPKALKLMLQFHHIPSASWSPHRWQNGDDPLLRDLMDTTRSYYWIVYPKCYQLWTIMIIDSMDIKWYQYGQTPMFQWVGIGRDLRCQRLTTKNSWFLAPPGAPAEMLKGSLFVEGRLNWTEGCNSDNFTKQYLR